ncbi:MAG: hypothetical protein KDK07_07730 [Bauldia sp.]|nr:hypothetical protein [Bauldia sp.]
MSVSMAAEGPGEEQSPRRRIDDHGRAAGRALLTVLLFAAVGPLIGGLIVSLPDILTVIAAAHDAGNLFYFLFALVSVGVPAAYAMGVVPAAIVGAVIAIIDYGARRSDAWIAVVLGVLGGMLWPVPWGSPPATLASPLEIWFLVASVISTWVCWFLSTRTPRRREERPA